MKTKFNTQKHEKIRKNMQNEVNKIWGYLEEFAISLIKKRVHI